MSEVFILTVNEKYMYASPNIYDIVAELERKKYYADYTTKLYVVDTNMNITNMEFLTWYDNKFSNDKEETK